jgi:histidyl-tRNA synthetase
MIVEAELCAAASDVLAQLGFTNFTIRLNHRQVLAGVLEQAGVVADKQADALVALDKLDKIGAEGVGRELIERGVTSEAGAKLLHFFEGVAQLEHASELIADERLDIEGGVTRAEAFNAAMLGRLIEFLGDHEAGAQGADELRQILQFAAAAGVGGRIKIDPSLARGLSYYTGAIMEISVPDLASSLGGGGRYDNLVGMFSRQQVPACGFSLGLERIIVVMTEREMFPANLVRAAADVLVTIWDESSAADALALARELRAGGLRVDVYPERGDKVGKQFKYASAQGVPFVAVAGPDERARGEVSLKDMRSGEQQTVRSAAAAETLRKLIEGNSGR